MDEALKDVAQGKSLRKAAAAHGVKKTALFNRVHGGSSIKGRRRVLPADLENLLVERCKQVAEEGDAIKWDKVTELAKDLLKSKQDRTVALGRGWWRGFKRRRSHEWSSPDSAGDGATAPLPTLQCLASDGCQANSLAGDILSTSHDVERAHGNNAASMQAAPAPSCTLTSASMQWLALQAAAAAPSCTLTTASMQYLASAVWQAESLASDMLSTDHDVERAHEDNAASMQAAPAPSCTLTTASMQCLASAVCQAESLASDMLSTHHDMERAHEDNTASMQATPAPSCTLTTANLQGLASAACQAESLASNMLSTHHDVGRAHEDNAASMQAAPAPSCTLTTASIPQHPLCPTSGIRLCVFPGETSTAPEQCVGSHHSSHDECHSTLGEELGGEVISSNSETASHPTPPQSSTMDEAVQDVAQGKSLRKAAAAHGVKKTTLFDHVHGGSSIMGRRRVLPADLEDLLVERCKQMAEEGDAIKRDKVLELAKELLKSKQGRTVALGKGWWRGFKRRRSHEWSSPDTAADSAKAPLPTLQCLASAVCQAKSLASDMPSTSHDVERAHEDNAASMQAAPAPSCTLTTASMQCLASAVCQANSLAGDMLSTHHDVERAQENNAASMQAAPAPSCTLTTASMQCLASAVCQAKSLASDMPSTHHDVERAHEDNAASIQAAPAPSCTLTTASIPQHPLCPTSGIRICVFPGEASTAPEQCVGSHHSSHDECHSTLGEELGGEVPSSNSDTASHPTLPQRSAMDAAIADIARGRSLRQSAAAHGVKKTTLFCRLRGQSSIKGRRRTLPSDLEDLLVERCKQVAEEGVAIKRVKVLELAKELLKSKQGLTVTLGKGWWRGFKRRYSHEWTSLAGTDDSAKAPLPTLQCLASAVCQAKSLAGDSLYTHRGMERAHEDNAASMQAAPAPSCTLATTSIPQHPLCPTSGIRVCVFPGEASTAPEQCVGSHHSSHDECHSTLGEEIGGEVISSNSETASHPAPPQRSAMDAAIEDIASGRSLRQSAAAHGVKRTTLFCRLHGQSSVRGRPAKLSAGLESLLADYCKFMAGNGYGVMKKSVQELAEELLKSERGSPVSVGTGWWRGFKRRHPHVKSTPPAVSGASSQCGAVGVSSAPALALQSLAFAASQPLPLTSGSTSTLLPAVQGMENASTNTAPRLQAAGPVLSSARASGGQPCVICGEAAVEEVHQCDTCCYASHPQCRSALRADVTCPNCDVLC